MRWLNTRRQVTQRGATLAGYALVLASVAVTSLGAMSALTDNSEEFLSGTGDAIGEPRPESGQLAGLAFETPEGWTAPTGNSGGTVEPEEPKEPEEKQEDYSFEAGFVKVEWGGCLKERLGSIRRSKSCHDKKSPLSGLVNDDKTLQLKMKLTELCIGTTKNGLVKSKPCSKSGGPKWIAAPAGDRVMFMDAETLKCMDATTSGSGNQVRLSKCNAKDEGQLFLLP